MGYACTRVLPHHLRASLRLAQIVTLATLVRSVLFDRWITVTVGLMLLGGVVAAKRGRTWGVGLALAAAVAFPVMFLFGMGPAWLCLVGVAGALPFLATLPAFLKFDKQATALLALLAGGVGTGIAYAYHTYAWDIFTAFPSLQPGIYPHHGLPMLAAVVLGMVLSQRRHEAPVPAHSGVRIADGADGEERIRIAALEEADAAAHGEDEWETPARRQASRR